MKKLLASALIGLTTLFGTCPNQVEAATVNAFPAWKCAGKYRSYNAACKKADALKAKGCDTCIEKTNDGCYEVYYK